MIEIRMHGRGGQGAVVASKILADAAFREGRHVQAYPQFGVERRGAPVTAFARIGEEGETLFVRSQVYEPDHVVILDPTLMLSVDVLKGLKKGGWIILNTPQDPEELDFPHDYRVATVDAASIAIKYRLGSKTQPIVNTAILGAFARATGLVGLESLKEAIYNFAPVKKEENVKAAEEAYHSVKFRKEVRQNV
ncbi:MAG: pyruvate ferredoxin oxidoreductase [Candidatus Hydrothermota bacterium]|uniref:Pyruvate ferredoxin oxidoreductase n=1 Tax=candidate division WOR-3 bacterium TaxID=2052148 RepID=A0A7C1BCB9_UNCW3|nr:MAG: pyruvate ferredoxin oxidoreductase [Candidatus Hydrothermae bacterium]HDM90590.1 pyruvate ferredoxin oxidoreductase [candidate division WOR-3 bacterium]